MLDSTCHPYIAKYMEKTGARHDEIETELDRYLMERSGKNPFRFKPAAQLKASKESVRAVSAILELPEKTVRKSINSLKFYTGNYGVPQISKEDAFAVGDAADRSL